MGSQDTKGAKLEEIQKKVLETINKHNLIEPGEAVLVGVSGGPDSVCLLHVLHSLHASCLLGTSEIVAIHVNHMLRGNESDMDEQYVKNLCGEMGIELFTTHLNTREISANSGISIEEAARSGRYARFTLFAEKVGNCKIAVAHNKNDQAETVIMNIMRGTGMEGLKGMEYKRGRIIRPMLDIRRSEIEEYCEIAGLKPRIDSTNLQGIYTRNKVRLELIPYVRENFDVDIVESVTRMAGLARDDCSFLGMVAEEKYRECVNREYISGRDPGQDTGKDPNLCPGHCAGQYPGHYEDRDSGQHPGEAEGFAASMVELDVEKIAKCHGAIRKRIVRKAIERVKGDLNAIESIHVEKIIDLCINGRTGSTIHLPRNVRAAKSYGVLKIYVPGEPNGSCNRSCNGSGNGWGDGSLDRFSNVPCDESRNKPPGKVLHFNEKVKIPGITHMEMLGAYLKAEVIKREEFDTGVFRSLSHNSLVQFFDYDKLEDGINIRGREEGDVFFPYKCKGTKKLKDFFIDIKIPRETRSRVPLVAKGKDIVWVVGYKISDKYKVTGSTRNVLRLEFVRLQ
ncbi:MAG: tRNA lysidine(34) synthetase TilS [Clostridiaceae bacterium]|nr:tRNA lysidine(34) synthetase TilS [Clostridiaceae bacterium]